MPARRDRTVDEIREQTRLRVAKHRAGKPRNVTGNVTPPPGNVTGAAGETGGSVTPPAPPVSSSLLKEKRETKKIEHLLAGFEPRGYVHDERFWALLRTKYPLLDLELEVMKLAEWLDAPKNAKRKCSKAFVANWLQRADADREQRNAQAAQLRTQFVPSPGKPPDPEPVLPADVVLEPIDPGAYERHLLEAKRFTLSEKLAMGRNGRH